MSDYTIEDYMRLVTNRKGIDGNESRQDKYYRDIIQRHLDGNKFTWNWSAALFSGAWQLYRKMFLLGLGGWQLSLIFILLVRVPLGILLTLLCPPEIVSTFSTATGKYAILLSTLILFIVFNGFFGNILYVQHLKKKLDKQYHKCEPGVLSNTDTNAMLVGIFFSTIITFNSGYGSTLYFYSLWVLLMLSCHHIYVEDKKKVKIAILAI